MSTSIESPLIGSGSPEEVIIRVNVLIDMGKTRGYLTYEELNHKLPDEVVSPDKLDSLLMMIDEMGIRLIDESDVAEFTTSQQTKAVKAAGAKVLKAAVLKKGEKISKAQPDNALPPELAGQAVEGAEEE